MRETILGFALILVCASLVWATQTEMKSNAVDQFLRIRPYTATQLRYQGDVSDTLVVDQLTLLNRRGYWRAIEEVKITIEITNLGSSAAIAIEGCTEIPGIWFNLRHKGLETITSADTLAYRFIGIQGLYAIRVHYAQGDSADIVTKFTFGY